MNGGSGFRVIHSLLLDISSSKTNKSEKLRMIDHINKISIRKDFGIFFNDEEKKEMCIDINNVLLDSNNEFLLYDTKCDYRDLKNLELTEDIFSHPEDVIYDYYIKPATDVIGALAQDIRKDWSDFVDQRIDDINSISEEFGLHYYVYDKDLEDIYEDGRWFQDCWDGPYGVCKLSDLEKIGRSIDIFNCKSSVLEN